MKYWIIIFAIFFTHSVVAAPLRTEFHKAVYALHEQQIAKHTIRTKEETGNYNGVAAAGYRYRITSYHDTATGRLLSRVERNADLPEAIHIVEVNIYGEDGKLLRDFFSSAPPWNPSHPSHAFISLHNYNGQLHSWRQFELTGEVNYELCEGDLDGKHVRISLDWSDINKKTTASSEYKACFGGMSNDWKSYLNPH